MKNWAATAQEIIRGQGQVILVTLGAVNGSTPRGSGTKMLIDDTRVSGTIGGGNLEFMVTEQARKMLKSPDRALLYQHYALGPLLGQCCGGAANVLLEKLTGCHLPLLGQITAAVEKRTPYGLMSATGGTEVGKHLVTIPSEDVQDGILYEWHPNDAAPLYMFGAGHVGKAMAAVLGRLNFEVTWIDDREGQFPELVADNVERILSPEPLKYVAAAPAGTIFLVFTYSHKQDYDITSAILKRTDFRYCGMIGSKTKRARFATYYLKSGGTEGQLEALTCPVGLKDITGKSPDVIAIAVAAQLLSIQEKHT